MPFCSQPADFVAVWDAYRAGDEKTAREHFDRTIMAVNRLGNQGGDIFYAMHKQLLVRQGVIRTAGAEVEIVDVDGAWVIPGFIDPHGHLLTHGMMAACVDLTEVRSIDAMVAASRP